MQQATCFLCRANDYVVLSTHKKDLYLKRLGQCHGEVRVVICKQCGLVYQNPRLEVADLEEIYSEKFRPGAPSEKYLRIIGADALDRMEWFKDRLPLDGQGKSVLDVGCAAGLFLKLLANAGWEAFGVEPEKAFAEYGREELGLNVETGYFTGETYGDRKFDLIVIAHILEHIESPISFLKISKQKLKDDGYLYVEVPNILRPKEPFYDSFFSSPHLQLFSPHTLGIVLHRAGFKVVEANDGKRGLRMLAKEREGPETLDLSPPPGQDWKSIRSIILSYKVKHFFAIKTKRFFTTTLPSNLRQFAKSVLYGIVGKSRGRSLIGWVKKRVSKETAS